MGQDIADGGHELTMTVGSGSKRSRTSSRSMLGTSPPAQESQAKLVRCVKRARPEQSTSGGLDWHS